MKNKTLFIYDYNDDITEIKNYYKNKVNKIKDKYIKKTSSLNNYIILIPTSFFIISVLLLKSLFLSFVILLLIGFVIFNVNNIITNKIKKEEQEELTDLFNKKEEHLDILYYLQDNDLIDVTLNTYSNSIKLIFEDKFSKKKTTLAFNHFDFKISSPSIGIDLDNMSIYV